MLRRILVPVDFSTASARALAVARDYAPEGAIIRLLHVLNPSQLAEDSANPVINPMHAREIQTEAEHQALEKLRTWMREGEETAIEVGSAAEKISEHADDWGADLIAMGTRGRTGLSHFLQGSATEWLVRHARQPVLAVHYARMTFVHHVRCERVTIDTALWFENGRQRHLDGVVIAEVKQERLSRESDFMKLMQERRLLPLSISKRAAAASALYQ